MGQTSRDAFELKHLPVRAQERRFNIAKGALRGMETWYSTYEDKDREMRRTGRMLKRLDELMDRFHGTQIVRALI
jgi:hypothetical protein